MVGKRFFRIRKSSEFTEEIKGENNMDLTLGIILGMIAHELFHIFLAIGGFTIVKKIISKHKCCTHKHKTDEKE